MQAHTGLLSVLVIALTITMIYARRQDSSLLYPFIAVCIAITIAPGTSYSYYVALFLVPAAFVFAIRSRSAGRGERRRSGRGSSTGAMPPFPDGTKSRVGC